MTKTKNKKKNLWPSKTTTAKTTATISSVKVDT